MSKRNSLIDHSIFLHVDRNDAQVHFVQSIERWNPDQLSLHVGAALLFCCSYIRFFPSSTTRKKKRKSLRTTIDLDAAEVNDTVLCSEKRQALDLVEELRSIEMFFAEFSSNDKNQGARASRRYLHAVEKVNGKKKMNFLSSLLFSLSLLHPHPYIPSSLSLSPSFFLPFSLALHMPRHAPDVESNATNNLLVKKTRFIRSIGIICSSID